MPSLLPPRHSACIQLSVKLVMLSTKVLFSNDTTFVFDTSEVRVTAKKSQLNFIILVSEPRNRCLGVDNDRKGCFVLQRAASTNCRR